MRKITLDESWLRDVYLGQKKSMSEIAKMVGCTHGTVLRRLAECGIPARSRSEFQQGKIRKANVSSEWLYEQYVVEGQTTQTLAEQLGCSARAIKSRLEQYGIPLRNPGMREGHKMSETTKIKMSKTRKGKSLPQKTRLKLSELQKRRPSGWSANTEEIKEKRIAGTRKYWKTVPLEQRRTRTLPAVLASRRANPSSIEQAIEAVLKALGEPYESQKRVGHFIVDFYLPARNLVIECDGRYWHSFPDVKEKDKRRDAELRKMGYSVLRLSEEVIRKDPEQALLSGLKAI